MKKLLGILTFALLASMVNAQEVVTREVGEDDYKAVFNQFDTTSDGFLNLVEVSAMFLELGYSIPADQLKSQFKLVDLNGDDLVNFEEFMGFIADANANTDASIDVAFQQFDRDGNGSIDKAEVMNLMKLLGQEITDAKAVEMIAEVDKNDDKIISRTEFDALFAPDPE